MASKTKCCTDRKRGITMRKYVEVLTATMLSKTTGNHSVIVENGRVNIRSDETGKARTVYSTRHFQYHGNTICAVDDYRGAFLVIPCGMVHIVNVVCCEWI